jgi:dienelactone hydrolase
MCDRFADRVLAVRETVESRRLKRGAVLGKFGGTRAWVVRLVVMVALVWLTGCGVGLDSQLSNLRPPDTGAAGPYVVGFTVHYFTRTLADGRPRKLATDIWYPSPPEQPNDPPMTDQFKAKLGIAPSNDKRHPLVVFSHGYGGRPATQSLFLSHLASYGFVVAAPEHEDCATSPCPPGPPWYSEPTTAEQAGRRLEDVRAVVDNMLALNDDDDPIFKGLIDPRQVGIAGQSFGGWTTLQSLQLDQRFRAGLALNPATSIRPPPDPSSISNPVMMMAGELDALVSFRGLEAFFSRIPTTASDHFLVVVPRAGHEFFDRCFPDMAMVPCSSTLPQDKLNEIMARFGTAFLLRYVADETIYDRALQAFSSPEVSLVHTTTGSVAGALPTAEPIPYPTSVLPSLMPAGPPGTLIASDDMLDPSRGLLTSAPGGPGTYSRAYVNGEYVIRSPVPPATGVSFPNQVESVVAGIYANASLAVDVRLVDPRADQWANIACRSQDDRSQYRLTILPAQGVVQLVRWVGGSGLVLFGPQTSAALHPGDQINRLELSCHDGTLDAAINDVRVASVSDATFAAGQMWIGLGHGTVGSPEAATPLDGPVEGHFTRLLITQQ